MPTNGGPRVLLISDQQRLIDAFVTALRSRWPEAEIQTAWNAATGVQLVVGCTPELVVLDADLPDRHGADVLTDIRRSSDVPVVLLTDGGRWSDESRAQGIEANLRLPKPFSMEALMRFARRVLDGDERFPASRCAGNDRVVQPPDAKCPLASEPPHE
jgi:DNA-binding response OmpR family regulator